MTLVFVHGNPETAAIWDALVAVLDEPDVVRLSPPGFGAPVPPGWHATPIAYRDWLVQQLEAIGMPVDLVGHDWGGAHAIGVAMTRPDMLRSWCVDTIGWFEPDYTWHSLARTWQTPGPGEIAAAEMTHSSLTRRTAYLSGLRIPARIAAELASGANRVAASCMLELYRTSQQPVMRHLGEQLPAAAQRPGLVLLATADYGTGTGAARRKAAERAGAQVAVLAGLGHWWMLQDPATVAPVLREFWSAAT